MPTKVKSALIACSDALETAFAWSLLVVGLYLVTFVDVTGAGSLYSSLGGLRENAQAAVAQPNAFRTIAVSARARDAVPSENRVLVVVDRELMEPQVSASIPAPDSFVGWPSADPGAGKNWKRGLRGSLSNFTVYGQGDQASVVGFAAPSRRSASLPSATAIIPARGTAAEIGSMEATSRPGLRARGRSGGYVSAASVRNVR